MNFKFVAGLEIHVQLNTKTKMFCSCPTEGPDIPNTRVCPVCLGYPGTLPVLNREAVVMAIALGKASRFSTGRVPGYPRHTGHTRVLGMSGPSVGQLQNIFVFVLS